MLNQTVNLPCKRPVPQLPPKGVHLVTSCELSSFYIVHFFITDTWNKAMFIHQNANKYEFQEEFSFIKQFVVIKIYMLAICEIKRT